MSPLPSRSLPPPTQFIANLPYAVAATLVLDVFEKLPPVQNATVMVQKEVAQRMMASPGTKDYGAYTVKLQLFAAVTGSFAVSRTCFLPPPRVDSTVIKLKRRSDIAPPNVLAATVFIAEAAFAERRKTIRNSMRSYFSTHNANPNMVDSLLESAQVLPTRRGESVSPQEYLAMGELLQNLFQKLSRNMT